VPGDLRVDDFGAQRLEPAKRAFLVGLDQPRIAGDIGRQNGREPTFDPLMLPGTHRGSPLSCRSYYGLRTWDRRPHPAVIAFRGASCSAGLSP
jgi:hypothetical protein